MITDTKIGIGIVHCQSTPGSTDIGFTPVFKSDNGQWSSLIDDTGDVFRHIKIDYETIIRMIHFSKDGWYLCSMKPIPGRDEEYRASWVYFPSSIELSQRDIKAIIEVAESQIKEKEFDSNKLQELILAYQKINFDSPRYNVPSTQCGYAFRDVSGDYNLFDLYGCIYQKEFTQYEWVILMDRSALKFKGDSIIDISDKKIVESHVIKPVPNDFGFTSYNNGVVFNSPIRIMDGESLSIEYKKDGYLPISKTVKRQEDLVLNPDECKRYYWIANFRVIDSETKKIISGCKLDFHGREIRKDTKGQQYIVIKESEVSSIKFKCLAEGYVEDEFDFDFTNKSNTEPIEVELTPESHTYTFVLRLNEDVVRRKNINVKEIPFPIISQKKLTDADIKELIPGYTCVGSISERGNNYLRVDNSYKNGNTKGGNQPPKPGTPPKVGGYAEPVRGGNHNGGSHHHGYYGNPDERRSPKWKKLIQGSIKIIVALACLGLLGYFVYDTFFREDPPISKNDGGIVETGNQGGTTVPPTDNWSTTFDYLKKHTSEIRKDDMECYDELKGLYDIINGYRFKDYIEFINSHKHRSDILSIDIWNRLYNKSLEINANKKGIYNSDSIEQVIEFENYLKKDFSQKLDDVADEGLGQKSESSYKKTQESKKMDNTHQGETGKKPSSKSKNTQNTNQQSNNQGSNI